MPANVLYFTLTLPRDDKKLIGKFHVVNVSVPVPLPCQNEKNME